MSVTAARARLRYASRARAANVSSAARISFPERQYFIAGSDARIIMGDDVVALQLLWQKDHHPISGSCPDKAAEDT